MQYTAIDGVDVADQFLLDNVLAADAMAVGAIIDQAKIEFAQQVRLVGGLSRDPALDDLKAQAAAKQAEAEAKRTSRGQRIVRITGVAAKVKAARKVLVKQWIANWEAEHAQHAMIITLAEAPGQVADSQAALIALEGAWTQAKVELAKP